MQAVWSIYCSFYWLEGIAFYFKADSHTVDTQYIKERQNH